ncbi:MAG: glycosyltransferase family 2 protein [Phycisphaerae bacterium]|nr:glycosyltransferase family 2 protein [Phycisphaerae bacterium]
MMEQTSVTVVIPCFNYGRFVGEAVASALSQREADVRVVVVDDGSDDGTTPAVCDALAGDRVRVVHQANGGPGSARNTGSALADTTYLVFLDADDTIDPWFVRRLAERIEEGSREAGPPISHAYCQEVLTGQAHGTWRVAEWDPLLLMVTNLHPVTALVRRRCFEEVGGFEASMRGDYEDWDLWLRLSFLGYRGARVAEPLFFWRRHSDDTMVMRAVRSHDETFSRIVERHRERYLRHALDLIRLSNGMLRRFDCNWIDETGYPIPLRYLWTRSERADELEAKEAARLAEESSVREHAAYLKARNDELGREFIDQARQAQDSLRALRDHYESYTVVRLHRAWHRMVSGLPGPLAWIPRQAARALRAISR